jgi:NAD-dependent dihydropyrimidine dehydrogenase PreA subunit
MSDFSVTLPSGATRTPTFVQSINEEKCIGCTACSKICPRKSYTHAAAAV